MKFLIWSIRDLYNWSVCENRPRNWLTGAQTDVKPVDNKDSKMHDDTEAKRRTIQSKIKFWNPDERLKCWKRFLLLALPMLTQALDSVSDGLYFLNLKLEARLVHVPIWVHIFQGVLLFTCKLSTISPKYKFRLFSHDQRFYNCLSGLQYGEKSFRLGDHETRAKSKDHSKNGDFSRLLHIRRYRPSAVAGKGLFRCH